MAYVVVLVAGLLVAAEGQVKDMGYHSQHKHPRNPNEGRGNYTSKASASDYSKFVMRYVGDYSKSMRNSIRLGRKKGIASLSRSRFPQQVQFGEDRLAERDPPGEPSSPVLGDLGPFGSTEQFGSGLNSMQIHFR